MGFPSDFCWGTATAAYQIEGAVAEGGRTPSIWDTFAHTPGTTRDGDTGDVACDHYHRYSSDVALMSELGISAYRLSLSWSRLVVDGTGEVNPEGVVFYRRLLTALRGAGIAAYVTLYHWDLPQPLQDAGGWANRATVDAFARYAALAIAALGDLVDGWITLNEPYCIADLGHSEGVHAPGIRDDRIRNQVVHHLNLAHGGGARALRAGGAGWIGIVLNPAVLRPQVDDAEHRLALALGHDLVNGRFEGPMLHGSYPATFKAYAWNEGLSEVYRDGDEELAAGPTDFVGVNYYSSHLVGKDDSPLGYGVVPNPGVAANVLGWTVDPPAFTELLDRLWRDHGLPLIVTENGAPLLDEQVVDGRVHDGDRVRYLHDHVSAVADAIAAGADVRGYFVWSFMDNFEWAYGYAPRFGICHVDYDTQVRTPKDSALWYRALIGTGELPAAPPYRDFLPGGVRL